MDLQQLNPWYLLTNPQGYFFWLVCVSLLCLGLERVFPWRRQKLWRAQFGQDLIWLVVNGHYAGLLLAFAAGKLTTWLEQMTGRPLFSAPANYQLLHDAPLWVQFIVFFLLKDLLDYAIHNLLHRVPFLWRWHQVHHSIETMDWIGNFRFHQLEIVVYQSLSWLPLVILGVDGRIMLVIAVIATLIGHLNHANLNWHYGPLRFVLNSPRFHIHHHDVIARGGVGKNFAVVFSVWDWLFGTAYAPENEPPQKLGFENIDQFPTSLWGRFLYPFRKNP